MILNADYRSVLNVITYISCWYIHRHYSNDYIIGFVQYLKIKRQTFNINTIHKRFKTSVWSIKREVCLASQTKKKKKQVQPTILSIQMSNTNSGIWQLLSYSSFLCMFHWRLFWCSTVLLLFRCFLIVDVFLSIKFETRVCSLNQFTTF